MHRPRELSFVVGVTNPSFPYFIPLKTVLRRAPLRWRPHVPVVVLTLAGSARMTYCAHRRRGPRPVPRAPALCMGRGHTGPTLS